MYSTRYSSHILKILKFSLRTRIFKKNSYIKFNKNPSSGSRVVPCEGTDGRRDRETEGQTDMTELIFVFAIFPNAPEIHIYVHAQKR